MTTPIDDFVRAYADSGALRLHMPGHKGAGETEKYDITEIDGADELYFPDGMIAESEANASGLFGCPTFYSTEGSSHCVRAMLYLALSRRGNAGRRRKVAAARNMHASFVSAAALLDFDIVTLPFSSRMLAGANTDARSVEAVLAADPEIDAVFLTSPDYLGNITAVAAVSRVCRERGVPLLVDCAHGEYFRFVQYFPHPMDCGADMCCGSAHKTLPALTGAAYLHVTNEYAAGAKEALALFGSTSPSYLTLASLDRLNAKLAGHWPELCESAVAQTLELRWMIELAGFECVGTEGLKVSVAPKSMGYTGDELAEILREKNIIVEFHDPDVITMMTGVNVSEDRLLGVGEVFGTIPKRDPISDAPPPIRPAKRVMTVREAVFAPRETVPVGEAAGRVCAAVAQSCPPAIPPVVCGELIDGDAVALMRYYGIKQVRVVK